jgi:hypothetical protein
MQYDWHFSNGSRVRCGNFSAKYNSVMPRGAHMRIGHHAVVVGDNGDLAAARIYATHSLDDPKCDITRASRHWDAHRREDIMADIARERAALA